MLKRPLDQKRLFDNKDGFEIVLTASRPEMSHYDNNPFLAFVCTFPEVFSKPLLEKHFNPNADENGFEKFAPYGLRKVEALLIDEFGKEKVFTAHYDNLHEFIGKKTKIVCITSMDPMGLAYVSTTYNSLIGFGGDPVNTSEFNRLIKHPSLEKYRPIIILGGAGAWQIRDAGTQDEFGIDVLFQGEGERDLISVIHKLLDGADVPKYYRAKKPSREDVPIIKHAASYGMVEITRGCGGVVSFALPHYGQSILFPLNI